MTGSPNRLADGEPQTLMDWFRVNGSTILFGLVFIAALALANELYLHISYAGASWSLLGLGFIIFIHELGHFLVAKWCDVHVTTFSIGFGPPLPFCSFTWGETTYKLAVFPLGGYVQMVGQVDGDESSDGSEDDPRSYKNKSVWQRMAIISAGVIMNAIFACIAFAAVFLGPGKPRPGGIVAGIESGKPAFTQGLRYGAEIIKVNDIEHPYFDDLRYETVATLGRIEVVTQRPGIDKEPLVYDITPHQGSMRVIGIQPPWRVAIASAKMLPGFSSPVVPGNSLGAAAKAFEFDDVIVGVTDPEHPDDPAKIAASRRSPESRQPCQGLFRVPAAHDAHGRQGRHHPSGSRAGREQEDCGHQGAAGVSQDAGSAHEDGANHRGA